MAILNQHLKSILSLLDKRDTTTIRHPRDQIVLRRLKRVEDRCRLLDGSQCVHFSILALLDVQHIVRVIHLAELDHRAILLSARYDMSLFSWMFPLTLGTLSPSSVLSLIEAETTELLG